MDGRSARWEAHNAAQRLRIVTSAIALYDEGRAGASLQEIGRRAGVARSVVYRQFADRRDLERAVQQHILDDLSAQLVPTLGPRPGDTVRTALRRAASTYVGWAAGHPRLHQLADVDVDADGPLQHALDHVAGVIAGLLVAWFTDAGAQVSAADRAATDPLAHGLVGAAFATVRRWVHLGAHVPDAEHLTELLVESTWALIDVRARAFGLVLDPDVPVEAVLRSPGTG